MNSKRKFDFVGGDNQDNSWMGGVAISVIILAILLAIFTCWVTGCSPKIIEKVETKIEYRERVVHDTATFEVPVEVEKIVTKDTSSHLENRFAKSDAIVSGGFLSHSLESKPQIIKVPVEVHVTDTLIKEAEIKEVIKEVDKPLSWWKSTKIEAFWWLLGGLVLCLLWIFRKPLLKLIHL